MKCPKCKGDVKITHTYIGGNQTKTQRAECQNLRCQSVLTLQTTVVAVNPTKGNGAAALAKRLRSA